MAEQDPNPTLVAEPPELPAGSSLPAPEPAPQLDQVFTQLKVTQGQAHRAEERANRAEQRAASLEAMVNSLTVAVARGSPQATAPPDPLGEDVDPSIRAEFVRMRQEIASLSVQRNQDIAQSQERQWRDNAIAELEATAEMVGVDFSTVRRQVEALPTKELWDGGKQLIRQVRGDSALDEAKVRADERVKVLKEQGIYNEPRPSHGARPRTRSEEDAAYASGEMDTGEYAAIVKKRGG